jgi:hypothetical protein
MKKNVTLGIIIIFIGIIWLLSNLNIFSFSLINIFLRSLATLWPLILIGFGLSILLKKNGVYKLLIWLIILVTILLYGVAKVNSGTLDNEYSPSDYDYSASHDYSLSKDPATEEGKLNLNFAAGEISLASNNAKLLRLKSNIPNLKYDYRFLNGKKKVIIDFDKKKYLPFQGINKTLFCFLDLHKEVIWEMDLNLGAAKGDLDLRDLAVKKIELDVGAADLTLRLGDRHPHTDIEINAGASNLEIYLPKDVGLKIKLDSALADNNLADLGLEKNSDYHISPDFDSKPTKFLFHIDMGMGNLKFRTA